MIKIISKEKGLNIIDMHKKVNGIKRGSESVQRKPFDKLQNRLTDKMIPLATIRLILEPINILEMEKLFEENKSMCTKHYEESCLKDSMFIRDCSVEEATKMLKAVGIVDAYYLNPNVSNEFSRTVLGMLKNSHQALRFFLTAGAEGAEYLALSNISKSKENKSEKRKLFYALLLIQSFPTMIETELDFSPFEEEISEMEIDLLDASSVEIKLDKEDVEFIDGLLKEAKRNKVKTTGQLVDLLLKNSPSSFAKSVIGIEALKAVYGNSGEYSIQKEAIMLVYYMLSLNNLSASVEEKRARLALGLAVKDTIVETLEYKESLVKMLIDNGIFKGLVQDNSIANLEDKISLLTKKLNDKDKEIAKAKHEYSKNLELEIIELKRELSKVKDENDSLKDKLEYKEEYIKGLIEDANADYGESKESLKLEYVNHDKIYLVGGYPQIIRRLKEYFPNLVWIDDSLINIPKENVFLLTRFTSHGMVRKLEAQNSKFTLINDLGVMQIAISIKNAIEKSKGL